MSFLNPWMLWGLGAAAVPIVIHLMNRRRFQRQPWAQMEWLLQAARQTQRRLQVENLLLLALRTLVVLLLAMALTRPTFSKTPIPLSESQHAHLFLLIDNSASMAARTGTRTAFEQAVGSAASYVSEIGGDDPVTLVVTNDNLVSGGGGTGRARAVVQGNRNHSVVRAVLSEMRPAAARADLAEALEVLEQEVPAAGGMPAKVAILTDAQALTVDGVAGRDRGEREAALEGVLTRLREKNADVFLVPIGAPQDHVIANVAVVSLAPDSDRDVVRGEPVVFVAEVANYGDRPVQAEIRFLVDGQERGATARTRSLPPRPAGDAAAPTTPVEFTVTFGPEETGYHVLEARVHADALTVDDSRAYAFNVREPIRVLAVDGDPRPRDRGRAPETWFLAPVLALEESGPFAVTTVDEDGYLQAPDLAAYDVVVLANVARPAPSEAARKRLDTFVAGGGALLLTVGDQVLPDVWNEELHRDGKGVLPVRLVRPVVVEDGRAFELDLVENPHPLLADITHRDNASFFTSPLLTGRMEVGELADEPQSRLVLRYANLTHPALVEKPFGLGRVLLYTSTVDDGWGHLPGAPLFPALLHETIYYLTARGNETRNLQAFQPLQRTFAKNFDNFTIVKPDGSTPQVDVDIPPDAPATVVFRDTAQVGVYRTTTRFKPDRLLAAPPPPVEEALAVNMTPLESDTRRLTAEELANRWRGLVRVSDGMEDSADVVQAGAGEIWRQLLMAALICLVAESILARTIGRGRVRGA